MQYVNVIVKILKVRELTFSPNGTSLWEYIVTHGVMVVAITLFEDDPIRTVINVQLIAFNNGKNKGHKSYESRICKRSGQNL